ncbi:MAG: 3-isopropylmalate dehydratase [Spirochaetes bacterium GWF1_41_5]|nr:MAG: 3-isopropylmalate dehydratase [Spirochaetes bacterium GWF1_41_5]HBE03284.1 3-isopropylmalate dehydratase small subunit [Spirochaetia bacterium]
MKEFGGKVLVLDRNDINTDEIIPAKYLTAAARKDLRDHVLEDLLLDSKPLSLNKIRSCRVAVTRANFGCGSSREHAAWVFEENGITAVLAVSFSRIFRQNMFNCGLLAIELPEEVIGKIIALSRDSETEIFINLEKKTISVHASAWSEEISFNLGIFEKKLVQTGGWVEYADKNY